MDIHVVHLPKQGINHSSNQTLNSFLSESRLDHLVFETCLRQIVFLESDLILNSHAFQNFSYLHADSIQVFKGERAYQFVLEVICGLHSLIKGETEIFGQFKEFSAKNKTVIDSLGMTDLFKQLLTDCKVLRSTRIQSWSRNTYGSVTRKLLNPSDNVALLGAGQLAEEIAPWLKHVKNKSLLLRRSKKLSAPFDGFQVQMTQNLNASADITVLVVAAKVTNDELKSFVKRWPNLRMVVDWRGDERWTPLNSERVFRLHDLKANDEKTKLEQKQRIHAVSADIQVKALEFTRKAKHNPWGWEDFCA